MQKDQLLELRSKIVQSTQKLALEGDGSATDRLQILMGIVRDGAATTEILARAYELIQLIETDDDKLTALLDLLYEVDAQLSALDNEQPSEGEAPQEPQHEESHEGSYDQPHEQ